jgi:hypothetical protein
VHFSARAGDHVGDGNVGDSDGVGDGDDSIRST